ncbi:MAG: hypothetical protein ABIS26_00340 [Candidatus Paceibacterota bacterium]
MGAGDFKPDQKQKEGVSEIDPLQSFRDAAAKARANAKLFESMGKGHEHDAKRALSSAEGYEKKIEDAETVAKARKETEGLNEEELTLLMKQAYRDYEQASKATNNAVNDSLPERAALRREEHRTHMRWMTIDIILQESAEEQK